MISIFKTVDSTQKVIHEYEDGCWVNVVNPSEIEIKTLSQKIGVPVDFLMNPLDIDERPRIEIEKGNIILILIRTPHFNNSEKIQYKTVPLGIIVTENIILTICSNNNDVIREFVRANVRGWDTAKRSRFVLQIFSRTALIYLDYLKQINQNSSEVEDRLQKAMKNKELIELLNLEKSLVYFTTSLRSNEIVMERLQRTEMLKLQPEDSEILENVITENQQALEIANIYTDILSSMMDAFASIISNNLNVVMKFLASATIILTLPILITGAYGMNIKLPLQDWIHTFSFLAGLSLVLSIIIVLIFIKRKWF